jgi:endonuclease YncB( thermonuclease family)
MGILGGLFAARQAIDPANFKRRRNSEERHVRHCGGMDWFGRQTRLFARIAAALLATLTAVSSADALEVSGRPRILDGDTIEIANMRIRLHGIDAAESRQRCVAAKQIVRPGQTAVRRLQALTSDGVSCTGMDFDKYGRLVAVCRSSAGEDIGRAMVREGMAWAFERYSRNYVADQGFARKANLGVWAMACDTPWDFRAKRWSVNSQSAPEGCAIKGNITKNGKIFHLPWNRDYTRVKIEREAGERWFCNAEEAMTAGWRPARR